MKNTETTKPSGLALLREPFPPHLISKLPKETKAQIEARRNNREGINCTVCGGWHHPRAVHLDYVGHAALTDRLLDADPNWYWEPMANAENGLPLFDQNGGLWIKLIVCGQTRIGYGCADGKNGGDAIKEIIGDALRNAAMRYGAALDLWHKGDLHAVQDEDGNTVSADLPTAKAAITDDQLKIIQDLVYKTQTDIAKFCKHYKVPSLKALSPEDYEHACNILIERLEKTND